MMKIRKALAAGFAATMLLAACGGGSSARDELVKELEQDGDLSEDQKDCVLEVADGYSDDELEEIKDVLTADGDVDPSSLSGNSAEFAAGAMECMLGGGSELVEEMIAGLGDDVTDEQKDCIRTALSGMSGEELLAMTEDPSGATDAMMECMLG